MNDKIIIITKDRERTSFLQACDVFENSKVVLGKVYEMEINKKKAQTIIKKIIKYSNGDILSAFSQQSGLGWHDESIKSISDGQKWDTFESFLKSSGYKI